jgi:hypothetical protein
VALGLPNTLFTTIKADGLLDFYHTIGSGAMELRDNPGLNNNWNGANFDQVAPIDLGCRIDGNWNENTVAAPLELRPLNPCPGPRSIGLLWDLPTRV